MNDKKKYGFNKTILHSDRQKSIEHGSLHKPIHTTVAFCYKDARELAAVFQGKQSGYRYGRQGNPTVAALEDKINRMEDGLSTICFSTGMAAIGAIRRRCSARATKSLRRLSCSGTRIAFGNPLLGRAPMYRWWMQLMSRMSKRH